MSIDSYLKTQLEPAQGQSHLSAVRPDIDQFIAANFANNQSFLNDFPDAKARGKKLADIRVDLENKLYANAVDGAKAGADPKPFKADASAAASQGMTGMVETGIDMLVGSVGGMFGMMWNFIKHLPMVSNLIDGISGLFSGQGGGESPEVQNKEKLAAGAASGLGKSIEVEGQVFVLSGSAQKKVYDGIVAGGDSNAPAAAPAPAASLNGITVPGLVVMPGTGAVTATPDNHATAPATPVGAATVVASAAK